MRRWVQAVEASIRRLSSLRQRIQRRQMFGEQRVWRSQLNHLMAQAHLALLHCGLAPPHIPAGHERCTHMHAHAHARAHAHPLISSDLIGRPHVYSSHLCIEYNFIYSIQM